jgi:hypothetical protein
VSTRKVMLPNVNIPSGFISGAEEVRKKKI